MSAKRKVKTGIEKKYNAIFLTFIFCTISAIKNRFITCILSSFFFFFTACQLIIEFIGKVHLDKKKIFILLKTSNKRVCNFYW